MNKNKELLRAKFKWKKSTVRTEALLPGNLAAKFKDQEVGDQPLLANPEDQQEEEASGADRRSLTRLHGHSSWRRQAQADLW